MQLRIDGQLTLTGASDDAIRIITADNTFPNPERQQAAQAGRRFEHLPETITIIENENDSLILPRGYLSTLFHHIPEHEFEILDQRIEQSIPAQPQHAICLRDYQERAVIAALASEQGIIQSPTGSGKTIMALILAERLGNRTLILTHSKELAGQWCTTIADLLNTNAGFIGSGQWQEGNLFTVAMLQTLHRRPQETASLGLNYGLIMVDEAHHIPARTFATVISQLPARYRYGLSATPHRRDGLTILIHRTIGPVLTQIKKNEVEQNGSIVPAIIRPIHTSFNPGNVNSWQEYVSVLTTDQTRNLLIIAIAEKAAKSMPVLILTDRVAHAEHLSQLTTRQHVLLHGQISATARKAAIQQIQSINFVIGTTGLLGEGLDVSQWSALILASPISSEVKLLQAIGRITRPHNDKRCGYVADLVDDCGFAIASFRKRMVFYAEQGFKIIERPEN